MDRPTPQGEIRCEYVVNAAGYYAREVGKWFGRDMPMMVMSHQYLLFDTIPELEAWSKESGSKLPLLRDVDSSYYLRQEKHGMNLGPYERNCKAHWVDASDPMPEDFSFQLFPDDLDRLEWYVNDAMERVPILATAGLSKVINGPIPYTPDGNPLIGPMPGVPNAFEACVFTFGICQAGGAGKVLVGMGDARRDGMGHVVVRSAPLHVLLRPGLLRGQGHGSLWPRICDAFPAARMAGWPQQEAFGNPRPHQARSAHNTAPTMAGSGRSGTRSRATTHRRRQRRPGRASGPWEPRIREECEAVRDAAGILDLPGFSRYRLKGRGRSAWLSTLITGVWCRSRAASALAISPTMAGGSSPKCRS